VTRQRQAGSLRLDDLTSERAVLGGAVLGGGGGGTLEAGLLLGQLAVGLGDATLVPPDHLPPDADLVVLATCCAGVAEEHLYRPLHHKRAVELLATNTGVSFAGVVNCGSGAQDTMVGWAQSALLGMPLVDAVIDPGLHPSAVMGLAELWSETGTPIYLSVVGYDRQGDPSLELYAHGEPRALQTILRQHASASEGDLVLACGPFSRQWLCTQARPNLLSQAIHIGQQILEIEDGTGSVVASAIGRLVGGQELMSGSITEVIWRGSGTKTYGTIRIRDRQNRDVELLSYGRYVTLHVAGSRVASFPDLIVTLGTKGTPLTGRELSRGQDLHVLVAPYKPHPPPMTARLKAVYRELESITGKPMGLPPIKEPWPVADGRKEVTAIEPA
jgi:DUF917 family protein